LELAIGRSIPLPMLPILLSGISKEEEALKDNPESLKGDFLAENKHPVIDTGVIQEPNGT